MTFRDDPRLNGREPEFAAMSLRPGIGRDAMFDVADVIMRFNLDNTQADVPVSLRHGKKLLPLGRYLRRNLREMIGKEATAPVDPEKEAEVLRMLDAAKKDEENPSLRYQVQKESSQKIASMKARAKIFKGRRPL